MARSYRYLQYDVFTDHLFGGNQLAVFLDGRGLSTETMQAIAKEMNFSETTFVLPPESAGTDVRMRIFTPGHELPIAGHPTIGSTFALARTGVVDPGRERVVFGLGIGPVPVSLTWNDGELGFAWMTQDQAVFGEPVTDRGAVAAALSVQPSAVTAATTPEPRAHRDWRERRRRDRDRPRRWPGGARGRGNPVRLAGLVTFCSRYARAPRREGVSAWGGPRE